MPSRSIARAALGQGREGKLLPLERQEGGQGRRDQGGRPRHPALPRDLGLEAQVQRRGFEPEDGDDGPGDVEVVAAEREVGARLPDEDPAARLDAGGGAARTRPSDPHACAQPDGARERAAAVLIARVAQQVGAGGGARRDHGRQGSGQRPRRGRACDAILYRIIQLFVWVQK